MRSRRDATRRDVAYFVDDQWAEHDARAFAAFRNGAHVGASEPSHDDRELIAFPWDHNVFGSLVRWAVLTPPADAQSGREDIAYFLDAEWAERDAKTFARQLGRQAG